jgi:hypothetical protein
MKMEMMKMEMMKMEMMKMEMMKMKVKFLFILIMGIFLFSLVAGGFDFENGVSDSDSTTFDTGGGAAQCNVNATDSYWEFSSGDKILIFTNGSFVEGVTSESGCYQENGLPTETCCPQDYTCNQDSGVCERDEVEIGSCSDYSGTSQSECEGANLENVKDSIYQVFLENLDKDSSVSNDEIPDIGELSFCNPDGDPQVFVLAGEQRIFGGCGCVWEEDTSKCNSVYSDQLYENEGSGNHYVCETSFNPLQDMCAEQDVYIMSWTVERKEVDSDGNVIDDNVPLDAGCQPGETTFDCPDESALPFFSWVNLLIASLAIAGIYFLMKRKI